MDPSLSFRPIREQDMEFLFHVYASTRAEEMAVVPWSDEEKDQFLNMQFTAQHTHYQEHYSDSQFDLILQDGEAIGRLYLDRRDDEFRIVDIALLPEHRGKGLGAGILQDILDEAGALNLPVRIHVESNNPAMNLYLRLGFVKTDDTGVYHLMERLPGDDDRRATDSEGATP